MNTLDRRWPATLVIVLSATLGACGGGGGGGGSDGGGSGGDSPAPPTVPTTPTPPTTPSKVLTLQGSLANASSLAGGTVTASFGSKTATATIGSGGSYSLLLGDYADTDFVTVTATGTSGSTRLVLRSLIGTAGAAATAAGTDKIVTSAELPALVLSATTTAQAGSIATDVATDTALQQALALLEPEKVFRVASAIQTVLGTSSIALPSGVATTFDLARAATTTREAFVQTLLKDDASQYASAAATLAASGPAFAAADVQGSWYLIFNSNEYDGDTGLYQFHTDGTVLVGNDGVAYAWHLDGGKVVVDYGTSDTAVYVDLNGDGNRYNDGRTSAQVSETEELTATGPADAKGQRAIVSRVVENTVYPGGELPPATRTFTQGAQLVPQAGAAGFSVALLSGQAYAMNTAILAADTFLVSPLADQLSFAADGSGTAVQQGTFKWVIDSTNALQITFDNGDVATYRLLRQVNGIQWKSAVEYTKAGTEDVVAFGSNVVTVNDSAQFASPAAGTYQYDRIGSSGAVEAFNELALLLKTDGTGSEPLIWNFNEANGLYGGAPHSATDDGNLPISAWTVDTARKLLVADTTFDTATGSYGCTLGASDTCDLDDHRRLEMVNRIGNLYYVRFYESFPQSSDPALAEQWQQSMVMTFEYDPSTAPLAATSGGVVAKASRATPAAIRMNRGVAARKFDTGSTRH